MSDENRFSIPKKVRRYSIVGGMIPENFMRKRKRLAEDDSISLQSFESGSTQKKKSSRKSLLRVSSIANLQSPKVTRKSDLFKLSFGFNATDNTNATKNTISLYKAPPPSPGRCRLSHTWSDMMTGDKEMLSKLTNQEIKLQESIYELYQGELDLIEDLNVVKNTYRDSMRKLHLMTDGELNQIFGPIDRLIPIHEDLVNRLKGQRLPNGTTHEVGRQLVEWVPHLEQYVSFCANQVFGKALLDEKKNDPAVNDFLQRCQESPFSRKLDLWGLLDGARGRFMKYALLFNSIHKYSSDWVDGKHLSEAIKLCETIVADADKEIGGAKCIYFKSRINYLYDDQRHKEIEKSSTLLCNGTLKNNKGSKLQLFLFDTILVLTRLVSQNGVQCFQVYRDPIPVSELIVEDLKDGDKKMGSFRSAFSSSQISKNLLRVSFRDSSKGQSHTLMTHDEHDKHQWLYWLRHALEKSH